MILIWTSFMMTNIDLYPNQKKKKRLLGPSVQFSSVSQKCLNFEIPWTAARPGLPVHHQLPEFTQIHIHRVSDAISHLILCRPLLLLSPIPTSIRIFSNESALCMRWPKYWSLKIPGSSRPRDRIWVSCIVGRSFNLWATREAQWRTRGRNQWLTFP